MDDAFVAARQFIVGNARLLERRLFATLFDGAAGTGVVEALRGYQNDDGGFGHGLEPDTRCPESLPIYVEVALQALVAAHAADPVMVRRAADFLLRTAETCGADGAVPLAFPVIEGFPRAEHWSEWTYRPGVNPTAGLVGLLYELGVDHPWRTMGEAWCWRELDSGRYPDEVHALAEVLVFLAQVPDRERADRQAVAVLERIVGCEMFHLDPGVPGYGLTPLTLAPLADSRWRPLFTTAQLDGHLDHLQQAQLPDGGWPISWEPPSEAARLEWRGMVTLQALRTLTSYGRIRATA